MFYTTVKTPNLTHRETQVLRCLAEGNSHKYAAGKLGLTRANVCNVAGRLRNKGFPCESLTDRNAAKAFLDSQATPATEKRVPGLTEYQLAILQRYAKGESYDAIAHHLGLERGKTIRPSTIEQAVSQSAQAIGAVRRGDPAYRRQVVAQWLKKNLSLYLDEMNPENY